ncbi:MAG TPA: LLM class flavin-dependent oxidoreductase [Gammaproteobacteria bacterium]|nr:LLM class flavin-dependent oxidoreductase [Gammaproteobacteria bacterium]MDP7660802.1 LLM class flavin-dependent oxidoreductase [Gammaproteobacteria bacterium]HJP39606.1 LLM class flavin-dependent oxidoreductase [Gammaproteobacteria bacterium]
MDIDIILEPDLTPQQITELGQAAERYGIRALWTSNYFAHWDPFISLVPLAQSTNKLLMGPLAVSPFEMHPLKIANGLLSLNEICNGRAQVAIGAGEGNLDAMDLKKPKKIVLAIREALEIVLAATHGNLKDGYNGEIFNVNLPCAYDWLSASSPKIYMTAYRYMMMRMGGRIADGVFVGCTPPEIMQPAMENVNIGLSRRDMPADNFRTNTFWAWHIKADRDEAYRESRRELAWRGRKLDPELLINWLTEEEAQFVQDSFTAYVTAYFDRTGIVKGVSDDINDRLMHGMTSTGGLDALDREIERFKLFHKQGLTEIALRLHEDPMDALKIIGEQVVPKLK